VCVNSFRHFASNPHKALSLPGCLLRPLGTAPGHPRLDEAYSSTPLSVRGTCPLLPTGFGHGATSALGSVPYAVGSLGCENLTALPFGCAIASMKVQDTSDAAKGNLLSSELCAVWMVSMLRIHGLFKPTHRIRRM
jgi:hypothetical protein